VTDSRAASGSVAASATNNGSSSSTSKSSPSGSKSAKIRATSARPSRSRRGPVGEVGEGDLDRHGLRLGPEGGEDRLEQPTFEVGLEGQDEAATRPDGALGAAPGGVERLESGPRLVEQHPAGVGQRDVAGRAIEEADAELRL
jgi:hypothetical protein